MVGQASDLTSSKIDLMHIAMGMQTACQLDNAEHNGVLKAFRMAGWLAHRPTPHGLVPYVGPGWRNYPLGSGRLSHVIKDRMTMVPLNGKPPKPDWTQLRDLRRRQRMAYVQQAYKNISQDLAANLINYTPNLSRGQIGFEVGVHWAALITHRG